MKHYVNRRNEIRLYFRKPITIEELGINFLFRARLANYSRNGIYFETDLLLNPGARVYIGVQDSTHRLVSEDCGSFCVEIIWRKRSTDISFNYGYGAKVAFDKTEKEPQSNDHVELKELRKNPRKTFRKLIYFSSENKYYKGAIKNISCNGAFIESKANFFNRGELKLVVQGNKKYILLQGEIIHIKSTGFGVEFKSVLKKERIYRAKKTTIN